MFTLSWSKHGTDNCWATTCGCKIKAPSLKKGKQKWISRKLNASKRNKKIKKREKRKCFFPALPIVKKTKAFKRTEK